MYFTYYIPAVETVMGEADIPLVKEKLRGEELDGNASRFRSSLPRSSNKPFYNKTLKLFKFHMTLQIIDTLLV